MSSGGLVRGFGLWSTRMHALTLLEVPGHGRAEGRGEQLGAERGELEEAGGGAPEAGVEPGHLLSWFGWLVLVG